MTLSSDKIRKILTGDEGNQGITPKAFEILHLILKQRCKHGLKTVYDATSLRACDRKALRAIIKASAPETLIKGVLLPTGMKKCLERQYSRLRQVPESVIERHFILMEKNKASNPSFRI